MGWGERSNNKPHGANGHPVVGAPTDRAIPIIGQPFAVKNWFVTVVLKCNCEAKEPVTVAGTMGAVGQCPACRRGFQLQGIASRPDGQMEIKIGVLAPPRPQAPPAGEDDPT